LEKGRSGQIQLRLLVGNVIANSPPFWMSVHIVDIEEKRDENGKQKR